MERMRVALAAGVGFFVVWFIAGQILFFATGGDIDESPLPGPAEYASVAIENESGLMLGSALLVVAAGLLLFFAGGLKARVGSSDDVLPAAVGGLVGVGMLLVLQAGLLVSSSLVAAEAPETAWVLYQQSTVLGFESFIVTLLGAVTTGAVAMVASRHTVPSWYWWTTVGMAVLLAVTGLLEGTGVIPNGRFSIIFGLWVLISGATLAATRATATT